MFTAQEILVGNADYPTEKIGENSRRFRQLGLGYANLGALLMAQGMPYDSDERPGVGGGDHRADDRPRVRHQRPHRRPHGAVRRATRRTRSRCSTCCACTGPRPPRSTRTNVPRRAARRRPALVGRGGRARRGARRAQLAGQRARTDGHHRPDDGLRHHRHRARPRAHQGEEARRWRHDADRQPDDPACAAQARLLRRARPTTIVELHRRAQDDHRRAGASRPSTCRCSRARWATTRSTTWVT